LTNLVCCHSCIAFYAAGTALAGPANDQGEKKIKKEQKTKKKYLQKGKVAIGRDENRQCAEHDHCLHVG